MKKAIAAFALSLILLFAAGRPAVTLADEYMDFEDDQDTVLFEFDGEEIFDAEEELFDEETEFRIIGTILRIL